MKKGIMRYLLLTLPLLSLFGCAKFVEDGNVNVNPNRPSNITLNTLLPAVIDATANNHYLVAYTTSLFSQQMASYQGGPLNDDQHRDVRMGLAYLGLYQTAMTNSRIMVDLAKENGSPHYSAIGKILTVMNLSLATDTYGDVPYSDAFKAPAVLYPTYDKQQDIYTAMFTLLNEAVAELDQANPKTFTPASDDLVYGGKIEHWKATAYFLKARLNLHLTKKGAVSAANEVLVNLASAYTPASKDFQLVYNDKNLNPWNKNIAIKVKTGNYFITHSKRFVDALNGTSYPGLIDPRLSAIMDKKTAATYFGLINGAGNTGASVDLTENTWYAKAGSPLLMATYAEQKFMEAEARFLANGGTATSVGSTQEAYDAYLAGIAAHMLKLGVNGTAYLNDPKVAVGAAALTLEHILREKQIALFLQPEAWVDVRRYDYNPALFKGMALPQNQDPALNGEYIRRSGFPLDEVNRNPNTAAAVKPLTEKMWWDQ